MLPHKEFVLAYENGSLGCSVSTLLTLRLFFAGKIHEKKVSLNLYLWSVGFLVLTTAFIIGALRFPVVWAVFGTAVTLTVYVLAFFYWVGELVLSTALANQGFYEFATAQRVLWTYSDDEKNLPKLQKALPMRRTRRPPR
jgi:hypothetical protein